MATPNLAPMSVDATLVNNGVKCVVYGKAGAGKTRLALTVPKPIILSAERGLLSIKGHGLQQLPEISTLAELVNAHNWLMTNAAARQFDTVFVDSISEIAEVVLRNAKSQTKDGRKAHDDAAELIIQTIFRAFRDMPRMHVVMIAKERGDMDQLSQTMQYQPSMPNSKLREALPYYFDYVFRYVHGMNADRTPWEALQCRADATSIAKARSGAVSMWEQPHLGNIFNKAMV
jgi:hypothetical protein